MAVTDSIADYLTRIRNAQQARHRVVEIPMSNTKKRMTEILYDQGFISKYKFDSDAGKQGIISIAIKYDKKTGTPTIRKMGRISKPGLKMSRVGNEPIEIPSGVTVDISKGNLVTVKGPKGELTEQVNSEMVLKMEDGVFNVGRPTEQKRHKAMHGLYRSLINNMVVGVSEGYKKELELVGVGYRANSTGQLLELTLGYSHPIMFAVPSEIKLTTLSEKGQTPRVILEGIDKQLIGQIAAKIKAFRKSEPYKGKGVKFVGEEIRRKQGKTAG